MKSAPKGKSSDKKTSAKNTKNKPSRSKTPRTYKPGHLELDEWQRTLRKEYGEQQEYKLRNTGDHPIFSDFLLTNPASEKTYKITVRSDKHFDNYCSCPDYRISNLGTCKHIEFTLSELMKKRGAKKAFKEGYTSPYSEVCLNYGLKREVKFRIGEGAPDKLLSLVDEFFDANRNLKSEQILNFHRFLNEIPKNNGHEVRCHVSFDCRQGYFSFEFLTEFVSLLHSEPPC